MDIYCSGLLGSLKIYVHVGLRFFAWKLHIRSLSTRLTSD